MKSNEIDLSIIHLPCRNRCQAREVKDEIGDGGVHSSNPCSSFRACSIRNCFTDKPMTYSRKREREREREKDMLR